VVRPSSPEFFVEFTYELPGARSKSVTSRKRWIGGNVFACIVVIASFIFMYWIFARAGFPIEGLVFSIVPLLLWAPRIWLFAWTLLPSKGKGQNKGV